MSSTLGRDRRYDLQATFWGTLRSEVRANHRLSIGTYLHDTLWHICKDTLDRTLWDELRDCICDNLTERDGM